MKIGSALAILLGLGVATYLFVATGPAVVLGLLAHAGSGVVVVIAFHGAQMLCDTFGWQALLKPHARPPLRTLMALRWIREGINNLLPVAQIGGEVVGARLLSLSGVGMAEAAAATAIDLTMEMLGQVAFTLIGLVLLLHLGPRSAELREAAGWALAALAMAGAGFAAAQWAGLFKLVERALLPLARQLGWRSLAELGGLHRAVLGLWSDPRRVLACGAWHFASWLLGGVEVMLACHYLGHDVGLRQGMVLESLSQAMKSMGFALPGGLGVQEGGLLLLGPLCGLPASDAMALSLFKRVREAALGVPALAAWRRLARRGGIPAPAVETAAKWP